jgi:hypothetical protein
MSTQNFDYFGKNLKFMGLLSTKASMSFYFSLFSLLFFVFGFEFKLQSYLLGSNMYKGMTTIIQLYFGIDCNDTQLVNFRDKKLAFNVFYLYEKSLISSNL